MQKKRCYLCGGKLVKGVCVDCGLDNYRNDRKSFQLNTTTAEFALDGKALERDSTETVSQDVQKNDTKLEYTFQNKKQNQQVRKKAKDSVEGNKHSPLRLIKTFFIAIIVITLLPFIVRFFVRGYYTFKNRYDIQTTQDSVSVKTHDFYERASYQLSEEGEHFELELTPGNYKIGVHIPEGIYSLELEEGSGLCREIAKDNNIHVSWWLSDYEKSLKDGAVQSVDDVHLYQNGYLIIDEGLKVRLTSDSAQMNKMIPQIENTVIDQVAVKEETQYIAGTDFPVGVYDLKSEEGFTGIKVEYGENRDSYWVNNKEVEGYKNIYLPEGAVVTGGIKASILVPVEMIESEDFTSYYENTQY